MNRKMMGMINLLSLMRIGRVRMIIKSTVIWVPAIPHQETGRSKIILAKNRARVAGLKMCLFWKRISLDAMASKLNKEVMATGVLVSMIRNRIKPVISPDLGQRKRPKRSLFNSQSAKRETETETLKWMRVSVWGNNK